MSSNRHRKLGEVIPHVAHYLAAELESGLAASLRRNPMEGRGISGLYHVFRETSLQPSGERERLWAVVIQCIAILTPRGRRSGRPSAHNPKIPMGVAIRRAGVSEHRLTRLLASKGSARRDQVIRLCRRLANNRASARFDLRTLARFVLSEEEHSALKIARHYHIAPKSDGNTEE